MKITTLKRTFSLLIMKGSPKRIPGPIGRGLGPRRGPNGVPPRYPKVRLINGVPRRHYESPGARSKSNYSVELAPLRRS